MSPTDVPGSDPLAPPAAALAGPLLRVRGLQKSFGANRVLKGVDFEVQRGDVVCLIGPSGSGKTTVLRTLNGLETPDGGVIEFADAEVTDFSRRPSKAQRMALRDRSAMVFQHHNLFPHLTVIENVIEGPVHAHGVPKAVAVQRAERLLDRVGLADKRDAYPFQLSGGQQQRVGIVRALALQPDLLLFDEPTSALDPELVGEVLVVLKELADEGWTMVIVTHELAFAREVADEVLFFDDGVILERGAPKALLANPTHERTRRFLDRILRPFED
ncbi:MULTISPECIES: amino acid ABC transporter ATP-binding protein [unclassified Microbacterium]|uniref:amino acid ABC transporter ATP-binding protein n=1 Tax=unclassified Microbacterium TaxID=2609290 RepID=UPI0025512421|nr:MULTISPECIES: amino acid ABC transporter ATP-binding protein [unclassified Microbacterium]WIM18424.1 amino acid ABC transporter ATP-binding protein [Microbacterium sp. zg-B185]